MVPNPDKHGIISDEGYIVFNWYTERQPLSEIVKGRFDIEIDDETVNDKVA